MLPSAKAETGDLPNDILASGGTNRDCHERRSVEEKKIAMTCASNIPDTVVPMAETSEEPILLLEAFAYVQ